MVVSCEVDPCADCRGQERYRDRLGRFARWPPRDDAILRALCCGVATFATAKTPNRPTACPDCSDPLVFRDDGHMDAMFGKPPNPVRGAP